MRGEKKAGGSLLSQSRGEDNFSAEVEPEQLLRPRINTNALMRFALASVAMLVFIIYNFAWYAYDYVFPEPLLTKQIHDEQDGQISGHDEIEVEIKAPERSVKPLLMALSMLPAFVLGLHQLRIFQLAMTEHTDSIYLLMNHGRMARRVLPLTITICLGYIFGFLFPYCWNYLRWDPDA